MSAPWFDPNTYAWIPGTALGVTAGLWGSLSGTLAPAGKGKSIVIGGGLVLIGASALMLLTAVIAYFSDQPYGIWYGFGLAGFIGCIVIGSLLPTMFRRYQAAEQQRMDASDLVE